MTLTLTKKKTILHLSSTSIVQGQSGGDYDLTWSTVDGGGGENSDGDYILSGTIGQSDVGQVASCEYHLSSGFWFVHGYIVNLVASTHPVCI